MKVLIIPSWYPTDKAPNSGIFFKEQAIALQNYGMKIAVTYPEIWSLRNLKENRNINIGFIKSYEEGILTYRLKGYNFFPKVKNATRIIFYKRLKKLFIKYTEENGLPDILHAHSVLWGGWAAAKISKEYNIPLIITEHSTAYQRNLIKQYQKKYIKEALSISKKLIVVGPGLEIEMQNYICKEKIIVIPNIVDTSRFIPSEDDNECKKFRFFSLAFLTQKKGIDILIRAFAKNFKGNESVELIIGGTGEERCNLEKLALEEGVKGQVSFLGDLSRERVVKEMQQCDVFVLPSRYETFGVVFIEALACGKPIIATKCGGPEMIVNADNGLLCDINNVNQLQEKMQYIYLNINEYNSEIIVKDCQNRFSPNSVCKRITKEYDGIIKDGFL